MIKQSSCVIKLFVQCHPAPLAIALNKTRYTCAERLLADDLCYAMNNRIIFFSMCAIFCLQAKAANGQCADITPAQERLACYDKTAQAPGGGGSAETRSYLTRSWDLDDRDDELLGDRQSPLRPYKLSYLIVRYSMDPNYYPISPTHSASNIPEDLEYKEIKFQFSQKAKLLNPVKVNFLGITAMRLWAAYTQQSNWQAFNAGDSSPFRETNYEPELILMLNTGNKQGLKLINIAYNHQSNGRNQNMSRSWNRFYLQGGWETQTLTLMARTWWRVPEDYTQDDNPDIEEYVGRADLNIRWEPEDSKQVVDVTLRNNLRLEQNRGFIQIDWATPVTVSKSTKLHVQLTSGYGESLIDYNFFQTTFGLGVSFRDW